MKLVYEMTNRLQFNDVTLSLALQEAHLGQLLCV